MLAHTQLSAGEVAQQLGFSELTNFIKFFRRNGRESPAEFRRRRSFLGADRRAAKGGGKAPVRASRRGQSSCAFAPRGRR